MSENTSITVSNYMRKPEAIARFIDVIGSEHGAKAYIQSVLIAVSASDALMKCTPQSVMRAAMRAATLGLSCDPALKQAWLVPYNKNVGTRDNPKWVSEAQFQPHYKGLYTLAMRTGKYWQINVSAVYEGQRVFENPLTGLHAVMDGSVLAQPDSYNAAYSVDVTVRRRKEQKIIGWIGYFKTKKGFEKSVWMSCVEIDDHARKYVKDYADDRGNVKNPNWKDPEKRQVMEMKTVLRQLLSWADLSGTENAQLAEALQSDNPEVIEGETHEADPEPHADGNPDPVTDETWKAWNRVRASAETYGVPHNKITREATTNSDLIAYIAELKSFVDGAEQQAKA